MTSTAAKQKEPSGSGWTAPSYEIDLSTEHAAALRNTLAAYVKAARRGPRTQPSGRGRQPASRSRNRAESTQVREWAKSQGIEVKERGRIPADLMARYKAATSN